MALFITFNNYLIFNPINKAGASRMNLFKIVGKDNQNMAKYIAENYI